MVMPTAPSNSVLTGVSCPTVTGCVAVGYSTTHPRPNVYVSHPLVEKLGGSEWRIVSLDAQAGGSEELTAVSCANSSSCTAVGSMADVDRPSATRPVALVLSDGR